VEFPNGNGKEATLTVSPPTNSTNPWAGMSIYQDPALTTGVNADWGPGANLAANGVVYLPQPDTSRQRWQQCRDLLEARREHDHGERQRRHEAHEWCVHIHGREGMVPGRGQPTSAVREAVRGPGVRGHLRAADP
jgi:hypothetical protein